MLTLVPQNEAEVKLIIGLVAKYEKKKKCFRIITPYDAQRNAIERELKSRKLPWEDKVFNVDSFQGECSFLNIYKPLLKPYLGNEADHIIISLVRSDKPGFLKNMRRANVLLTRSKQSMIICSSRKFLLDGKGSETLMGILAREMGEACWINGL